MPGAPRLSVVVPTRNRPALLREAVRSVLAQTCGDFELLVVDDWSEPPASLDQGDVSDRRVRIARPRAWSGGAGAKCSGVRQARGELVAFLDDDDLYEPTYLESALAAFEANPDLDVVFMGVEAIGEGAEARNADWRRRIDRILARAQTISHPDGLHVFRAGLLEALLELGMPMAFQRPVARRAASARAGDYEGAETYWDNEWTLRALREGCRAALLDRPLYRQRLGTTARMSDGDEREHARRNVAVLEKLYRERPPDHPAGAAFRAALASAYHRQGYAHRQAGERAKAWAAYRKSQAMAFRADRLKSFLGLLRP